MFRRKKPLGVSIREAARLFGVSRAAVNCMFKDGRFDGFTIGRHRSVKLESARRLMAS